MDALQTQANGNSLARSDSFKALLPKDDNENYSAIGFIRTLLPILQPLLVAIAGVKRRQPLQQLASQC